ncbi:MBL fold metallo-hydrolase [Stenotrophomonas mori]|uniref:MBL fold metallo-hydrolase n=1 Tax=Stenotrophomonas mori TaxID=2871096 RepID=A0ABT0SI99_9GAMM|nr:MBL fold metallo-hydrolase [Stenotrophomonas mori]MCL7714808.1 MBL fold metallo-hydrolase [Stenotrophomonas mori]
MNAGKCGAGRARPRRRFLAGCAGLATLALVPPAGCALAAAGADALRIQRLAWAGIRLQLPRETLFIDPLASPEAWGTALRDRLIPVDDAVGSTNVLITHAHNDHFDAAAVATALARGGTLVHALGAAPRPTPANAQLRPSALWEPQLLGGFTAAAVPAVDGNGDPQVSWVVTAGGRRIFHGGDTLWHGNWWRIARQFAPFDAVFLPINGARFGFLKPAVEQPGVLTPEQAVAAATILGTRRLIPIHYGIAGMDEYVEVEDAIGRLREAAQGKPLAIQALAPGDWLDWE